MLASIGELRTRPSGMMPSRRPKNTGQPSDPTEASALLQGATLLCRTCDWTWVAFGSYLASPRCPLCGFRWVDKLREV